MYDTTYKFYMKYIHVLPDYKKKHFFLNVNTAIVPSLINLKVQIFCSHASTCATLKYMQHSKWTDVYFKTNSIMFMNPAKHHKLSKIKIACRNTVDIGVFFKKKKHICLNLLADTPLFKASQVF